MILSLADFIEYLRQRNFKVGVEHLLRAQILLDTIDQDYSLPQFLKRLHQEQPAEIKDQPPDKLKARLCPLFASNWEEQSRFYEAFDDYVSYLELKYPTTETKTQTQQPPKVRQHNWKWSAIALAILAAVSVAIILWMKLPRQTPDGPTATVSPTPTVSPVLTLSPTPRPTPVSATPPITTTTPPITPTLSQRPSPTPSPVWQPPAGKAYVAVFGLAMFLFLVYELATYLNRQRWLHTQRSKSPPFSWPLAVKRPPVKLYHSDQFFQAVRRLRRRRIREYHRLNIYATIAATIRSLGYPSFRYKPDTNIPEYLVLIDRRSFRDHQAHLFNELFKALKRDGLYITGFFYDRDPRRCFDETGKNFQQLSELRAKYVDHRILIFGDCDKFLDPKTGKLAEWVEVFSAWHERAILTPITPALWGFRETNLVTQFSILPATVAGLNALSDTFAPPITRELDWKYFEGDVLPRELNAENVVAELRPRLGEDVFQWLCACALYPELQWHLTLLIGSLSCMKADLITEENLLRLVRLPWFFAGTIPEDVRLALSQAVDQEKEIAVRAMIVDLLAKDQPPSGTFAADTYNVELALQQWLISRIPENLARLRLALKNIPANEIVNDQMLVTHLKRVPTSLLSRLVPPPLREKVYKYGLPYFGLKTATHFLIMLFIVVLVSLGLRAGAIPVLYPKPTAEASPSPDQPNGTTVLVHEPPMLFSPGSAKRGSDFQMTITLEQCRPGSFDDATLEAPVGIKINSTSISDDRCSFTARITIPANTPLGYVEFSLKRPIGTTQIPFTVTAVDCPTVTITESREGGNYRFTAVVVGGQPLSQPRFVWKVVGRDQQGQSIIDSSVPFTVQHSSSILIQEKDNNDPGIYLMVDVTVTGYDTSCRVNASGGGFPDESPSPSPTTSPTPSPTPTPSPPTPSPQFEVRFSANPTTVEVGQPVQFTAQYIGEPPPLMRSFNPSLALSISFDDGTFGRVSIDSPIVTHTYSSPGTYQVKKTPAVNGVPFESVAPSATVIVTPSSLGVIPNLIGKTESEVRNMFNPRMQFQLGTVSYGDDISRPSSPSGTVISQQPAAGTRAPNGTRIDIVVSKGPSTGSDQELIVVPNVIGYSVDRARALLADVGLKSKVEMSGGDFVVGDRTRGVPPSTIREQNPKAGTRVVRGTVVVLK